VIGEERVHAFELMAESVVEDVGRVPGPGGRALVCVDSLVLGMAILAEQSYWAHLCQTTDVMLVPWPDGSITRCFSSAQLRELITSTGLAGEAIRPRTALSPSMIDPVRRSGSGALQRLARTAPAP